MAMRAVDLGKYGIKPAYKGKFKGKVDLHFHSNYSDGRRDIDLSTICRAARMYGFRAIALTDHDTIAGLENFSRACKKFSVPFIPGVEITANVGGASGMSVDVLGYGFDPKDQALNSALRRLFLLGREKVKKMASWVNENLRSYQLDHGHEVDFPVILGPKEKAFSEDDVKRLLASIKYGGSFRREEMSLVLEKKGYTTSRYKDGRPASPTFDLIRAASKACIPLALDLPAALSLIHAASGLAFMAHPFKTVRKTASRTGEPPQQMISFILDKHDFDGLEVAWSMHTEEQTRQLRSLADERGLKMSGGSDTHWWEKKRVFGISPEAALSFQPWMRDRLII